MTRIEVSLFIAISRLLRPAPYAAMLDGWLHALNPLQCLEICGRYVQIGRIPQGDNSLLSLFEAPHGDRYGILTRVTGSAGCSSRWHRGNRPSGDHPELQPRGGTA